MILKNSFLKKDYLFDHETLLKFYSSVYYKTNKSNNKRLCFKLLRVLKETNKKHPLLTLNLAMHNGRIDVLTVKVKIAGRFHNIPVPVSITKQYSCFLKNLVVVSRSKINKDIGLRILDELEHLLYSTRGALQIKNDQSYDIAIDELPFAHFRWR